MKVSLYIPCFNAASTIGFCLKAVFKQTHPLKEVLVVDDVSTDESLKIVSRYPVKVIKHTENRGLAATRNTAIKNIDSEFIASLDADCIPEPDWLAQLMKRFNSSKIAGVGGRLLETYSSTVFDFWRSVHMKQHWGEKETLPNFLFGSNAAFRKKALIKAGLYNEKFKTNYEDVDMSLRLKKNDRVLVYEPRAIAHHFKNDNISSILNSYWKWNISYYQKGGFYRNTKNFTFKIKDNLGLANRYIEEDLDSKRYQLIYLDFLLALHHSLRDLEYFISQKNKRHPDYALFAFWFSLLDLTFFYHFDSGKNRLSTLIPKKDAFLQNLFALNLILGKCIGEIFKSEDFKKILYKHLLLSVYKIDSANLSEKLFLLVDLHKNWDGLFQKKQPNLNILFLKNLSLNFQKWLKDLTLRFPNIVEIIEMSAENIESSMPS